MTVSIMESSIVEASKAFAKPAGFRPSYGTAGFRAEASLLDSTVFRCGVLLAARALKTQQVTGICITASHNPAPDNGVKLVEPSGEMLVPAWEAHADVLANAATDEELAKLVSELFAKEGIKPGSGAVLIGHDTRPSSPALADAAAAGVRSLGVNPVLVGLLTTPQLHWMVMEKNLGHSYSEEDYFELLATSFARLVEGTEPLGQVLHIDCANGVGAGKLKQLAPRLAKSGLHLQLYNTGGGVLNGDCGSDFLQKDKALPQGFGDVPPGSRCCSVDGDSDRLMYFTPAEGGGATLMDGDKIASLAALLVKDLISKLPENGSAPTVGIVQTAYANGSSTAYMRGELGCEVALTPTGVKYLHEAAHHFDVGIYFEANGHGTVLFKHAFLDKLHELAPESAAARDLLALAGVINQAVGDAISGILMVEAALRRRQWGLEQWSALYTDLPSRQSKVLVRDRSAIQTANAETTVTQPQGLQPLIDEAVAAVKSGRSFVRPSGTEDVVRVYAEAATQEAADELATEVARLVHKHAGGVGPAP